MESSHAGQRSFWFCRTYLSRLVKPSQCPSAIPSRSKTFSSDDVFGNLVRGSDGRAEFSVQGVSEKISVFYGPKFPIAVVYAPKGRDFICFEPMSGPTNAFNMAQAGTYKDLHICAGRCKMAGEFTGSKPAASKRYSE